MNDANNFGALRLFAAVLVLFGHAFVITGHPVPIWFGMPVHIVAVHVFFVISGYLMAASWAADPAPLRFIARRALRIMPALIVVVVLTVLLLGPAFTRLPIGAYAIHPETRYYWWNLILAPHFALPGVFQDGRPFTAVNGSLWSLPIEAAFYAVTPLLAWRAGLPVLAAAAVGAAFTFTVLRPDQVEPVVYWSSVPFGLRFAADFILAAAVRSLRLERFLNAQAALAALALLGLIPAGPVLGAAVLLGIPYIVLSAGLAAPPLARGFGRRVDLSYGVYLWGCPVQQMAVSLLGGTAGPWGVMALSVPAACLLAWASWTWIERPCLSLKPGRRRLLLDVRAVPAKP